MLLTLVFTQNLCVYYLQIDPKLFTYNSLKIVTQSNTWQHISVTATTINREVKIHEPEHCYCKLSILSCTSRQIHLAAL